MYTNAVTTALRETKLRKYGRNAEQRQDRRAGSRRRRDSAAATAGRDEAHGARAEPGRYTRPSISTSSRYGLPLAKRAIERRPDLVGLAHLLGGHAEPARDRGEVDLGLR